MYSRSLLSCPDYQPQGCLVDPVHVLLHAGEVDRGEGAGGQDQVQKNLQLYKLV